MSDPIDDDDAFPEHFGKKYVMLIRNNATGEIRECGGWLQWHESSMFTMSDGNLGCDCTRAEAWAEAKNEEDPDVRCGDSAFTITEVVFEDGARLRVDSDEASER